VTITTILLDAGGVVLDETDHEAHHARVICEILGISNETYMEAVAEAVHCFVPRVYRFVIWRHLAPDRAAFEEAWRLFRVRLRASAPPLRLMAGIEDELRRLHGRLRIGLAGQYGAEILDLLRDENLLELLSWRFTQDDFDLTKPDPRYLLQIADACGVDPRECTMVGDRVDKDVIPAKQVGMRTVRIRLGLHVAQEPRMPEEAADVELPSVVGLADAALRLAASG
jgi:putative hydrolase of the HAD superfamily